MRKMLGFAGAGMAAMLLAACGGGGGGSAPIGGSSSGGGSSSSGGGSSSSSSGGGGGSVSVTIPTARTGIPQTVVPLVAVTLDGTGSSDPDGTINTYTWTQTAGVPTVMFDPGTGTTATPRFTAPTVTAATTLTFSLTVTDNSGNTSTASTVDVLVNPPPAAGNVVVSGIVTFARVPFGTVGSGVGLAYGSAAQVPARAVAVQLINEDNDTILANTVTDSQGRYWFSVAPNANLRTIVFARMQRDNTQALPRWDVRVQDGVAGTNPYQYTDNVTFNATANGITHDVAIPSGHNPDGSLTVARTATSAPFAILDTIYQGQQRILGVAPTTSFPALVVDWGSQDLGTFFSNTPSPHIALLADLATDTDEFDQHVIAHEFGHYIEHNFSRADNIGGSHGLGNRLDVRVAFGEGFGYAFAAMVLNDPIARDSFTNTVGTRTSAAFNVETNPPTSPLVPGDAGTWASESSVWSLLWDFYDTAADTNDTVAMGFAPLWNVLTGAQRTTPAATSIFPFATALKAAQTAQATAIDTLLSAQNITAATIDAYGSTETNVPTPVAMAAALPLFTSINVPGGPVTLRSVNDAGSHNKLGNHRFLRFTLAAGRTSTTITVTSNNLNAPDPDFRLYKQGVVVGTAAAGQGLPNANESFTYTSLTAGDYVLDVYECSNGCDDDDGTEGDYDLTVTIN